MRQGRRDDVDAFGCEKNSNLLDSRGVGAISAADKESFGVEPDNVAGFGGSGSFTCAENRDAFLLAELAMMLDFDTAVGFAGVHEDHAEIGSQGGVVGVNRVEGKVGRAGKFFEIGPGGS